MKVGTEISSATETRSGQKYLTISLGQAEVFLLRLDAVHLEGCIPRNDGLQTLSGWLYID